MDNLIHGANPENLYHAFNIPVPDKILDFSTNTNILSWPKLSINLEELASHYPDPDCNSLRRIISERENVSMNRILFTNGINEAIYLLAHSLSGTTAILQPCYPEYARAIVNLQNSFTVDDSCNYDNFILTNPNNPTGKYIPDLSRVITRYPDTLFIIDEAYIDFLIHDELRERLCDFSNVILLRSLTKIFHLSGVRIGYVIANEDVISRLKARQPTWSVNAIAQELALKFLNDEPFYADTIAFYRKNTPMFVDALRASGFDVIDSDVHYFLIRVDDDISVIRHLLMNGIAVRHTRNFAGLSGKYIRVATRFPEENEFFLHSLINMPDYFHGMQA